MRAGLRAVALVAAIVLVSPGAATPVVPPLVSFAATGDIAMAPSSDGGSSFFTGLGRALTGDVVIGNLEGTLATGGSSKCGSGSANCFAFRAPPSYGGLLKAAGFTVMNLANNHAYDFGATAAAETIRALERYGLRHTGRPAEVAILKVRGVRIAILGFAPYAWAQNMLDLNAARGLVRYADASADLVVVTVHMGAEGSSAQHVGPGLEVYLGERRGDPMQFAHTVIDAGADLVIGHGPHVLRAIEWYRGRLIAYSLGNFLGNGTFNISGASGISAVLQVTLRKDGKWAGGTLVPVRLVSPGVPRLDPAEAGHGIVRELSRQDLGKRGIRVSRTGVLSPPR